MGVKRPLEEDIAPSEKPFAPAAAPEAFDLVKNLKEIWDEVGEDDPAGALCLMAAEFDEPGVKEDFFEVVGPYVEKLEASISQRRYDILGQREEMMSKVDKLGAAVGKLAGGDAPADEPAPNGDAPPPKAEADEAAAAPTES